jgi:hypothetical protein
VLEYLKGSVIKLEDLTKLVLENLVKIHHQPKTDHEVMSENDAVMKFIGSTRRNIEFPNLP